MGQPWCGRVCSPAAMQSPLSVSPAPPIAGQAAVVGQGLWPGGLMGLAAAIA